MVNEESKRRIAALGYDPDNLIDPVRQTLEELSPEEINAALTFHERVRAKLAAKSAEEVQGYLAQYQQLAGGLRPRQTQQFAGGLAPPPPPPGINCF